MMVMMTIEKLKNKKYTYKKDNMRNIIVGLDDDEMMIFYNYNINTLLNKIMFEISFFPKRVKLQI